ncbi:hypothetical protein MJD09_23265 [bacterium]|nr:hypothetical protein [bacterium]
MHKVFAAGLGLLTCACGLTPQGDVIRSAVSGKGAAAMDEGLTNAEWFLCQAASVGSVKRRYGSSPERSKAYMDLCNATSTLTVLELSK